MPQSPPGATRPHSQIKSRSHEHWSRYWAGGVLTSLPEDFHGNYDGEIAAFWNRLFSDLEDGATVVDACAGNGALALLAAKFALSHGRDFSISAVDAARISPDRLLETYPSLASLISRVTFIDHTPLEEWVCPSGSLDLIVSQYGLEYCDQSRVAPRLTTMLKSGGRLAMLCHALSSDMLSTMRREADDYDLLEQLRVPRMIQSWLAGQLDSDSFRRRLHQAASRIVPRARASASPLLAYVLGIARRVNTMSEQALRQNRGALDDAWHQLVSGRGRLDDMLRVNQLMADKAWYQPWLDAGLTLADEGELLYKARHRVGQYYIFQRRPKKPGDA